MKNGKGCQEQEKVYKVIWLTSPQVEKIGEYKVC
jgi:hypothetical protein